MKGDKEDLIAIKDAIDTWALIQERITVESEHMSPSSMGISQMEDWRRLEILVGRMKDMMDLARHISEAIDEEALGIAKMVVPANPSSFLESGDLDNATKADKRQPIFTVRPQYVFQFHAPRMVLFPCISPIQIFAPTLELSPIPKRSRV